MKKMKFYSKLILLFVICTAFLILFSSLTIAQAEDSKHNQNDIFYVAKFVCGSIEDGQGPLRPGHYNTGINILNKKINDTTFFWNVSVDDGQVSHATMISLASQHSTGLDCKDIKKVSGVEEEKLVEGFVLITLPQNYNPAEPYALTTSLNNSTGLEVQVFYTANALDTLPHEVVLEKILFYILQDDTGKIPKDMIKTTLDVTLKSEINKISNTELKVKKILAQTFDLSESELNKIQIRIKDVSLGVGSMIDDHAISLSILKPQTNPFESD